MPASIKLKQEYGDDLTVIFVESQGADADTAEAFAWNMKWMGAGAMWTLERPVDVSGNTLPKFALLGADGTLLHSGNPLEMKKQIEESIAAEVKKSKDAPAGTPAALKKAWSAFAKGEIAAALAECDKLAADPVNGDAAAAARKEFASRIDARLRRAKWMLDNGYVSEAGRMLDVLEKATKANAELAAKVAEQKARLTGDATLAKEREASDALAKLVDKMSKDKPFEDGNVKALQKLAEKHAGTKTAERAAHLVALAKLKPMH